jgi:Holliday junction resolvasome RuvABC endonuclease subunit
VREGIGEAQRQQLAMLIEAAISTAVFEQLEHAADQADALAQQIRQHAEKYDKGTDSPP